MDWDSLSDAWVLKPNMAPRGAGILAAVERDESGDGWLTGSGSQLMRSDLVDHMRSVLDGEFSFQEVEKDWVICEKQVITHDALNELIF